MKRQNPNDATFRNINHLKKLIAGLLKRANRTDKRLLVITNRINTLRKRLL